MLEVRVLLFQKLALPLPDSSNTPSLLVGMRMTSLAEAKDVDIAVVESTSKTFMPWLVKMS